MMRSNQIRQIFFVLIFLELIAEGISQWTNNHTMIFLVKPLLMPTLMIFLWQSVKKPLSVLNKIILLSLFFSFLGDVFLMFIWSGKDLFLFGLVAFLIAHILYILGFRKIPLKKADSVSSMKFHAPVIIYCAILMFVLFWTGNADFKEMRIPVLIYTLVILTMVITALNRYGRVSMQSYQWVVWGALLFMFSDSVIALNKFTPTFESVPILARIMIMLTYTLGQYYIVKGCIAQAQIKIKI